MQITWKKYQYIAHSILRSLVDQGELRPGDEVDSESSLSQRFSVNRATVSKAVNFLIDGGVLSKARGQGVFLKSPAHAAILLKRFEEEGRAVFGEIPDRQGRRERIRIFSRLIHRGARELSDTFEHQVCFSLQEYARRFPCDFMYADADREDGLLQPDCLRELQRDGLLWIAPDRRDAAMIRDLHRRGVRLMLLESGPWPEGVCSVFSDEFHSGEMLAEHLLQFGHRRVLFCYWEHSNTNLARRRGMESRLAQAGGELEPLPFSHFPEEVLRERLRRDDRPTAVVSASQGGGLKILELAEESGIQVPNRMSVACFDDSYVLGFHVTPMTAVAQPIPALVMKAVQGLLALKRGQAPDGVTDQSLTSSLMIRRTVSFCPEEFVHTHEPETMRSQKRE